VETWIGGRGEIQSKILTTDKGAGIVALPRKNRLLKLTICNGRWLLPSNDFEVVLNQQAMELYNNPPLGSTLPLRVRDKTINSSCYAVFRQTHAG